MAFKLSVVIATYNRAALLGRLLEQLSGQTLPSSEFEVVVVDDGSKEPTAELLAGLVSQLPYHLVLVEQKNAGAAAARNKGVGLAEGHLVLITDDDMQVEPTFLEHHLRAHEGGRRVVIGRIKPDPAVSQMPLFERWYAKIQDSVAERMARGEHRLRGNSLLTGNVSLRRADFLEVGGFDTSLGHSEDSELGLRLEKLGVEFTYSQEACVFHGSDHTDTGMFLRRARKYGVFDSRIFRKHPDLPHASPWRYLFRIHPAARPLLGAAFLFPRLTNPVSQVALAATEAADKAGLSRLAFGGTAVVYAMEYFRGVREEAGSLPDAAKALVDYARSR